MKHIGKLGVPDVLLEFVYQSDCEGKLTPKQARAIYEIIKDKTLDRSYGYVRYTRSFDDIKDIFKDSFTKRVNIKWS